MEYWSDGKLGVNLELTVEINKQKDLIKGDGCRYRCD